MPINTSPGAAPVFLSKSYVTSDAYNAGVVVSSPASSLLYRLHQLDPTSPAVVGNADDTQTVVITIPLYEGAAQAQRTINFLALLNFNFKRFKVEWSLGGGAFTAFAGADYSGADYSGADLVLFLASSIVADTIKITITTTSPANQSKSLACAITALINFQPTRPYTSLAPAPREARKSADFPDGSKAYGFFYWSDNSFRLWDFAPVFDYVDHVSAATADKAKFDSLLSGITSAEPFLFYSEPGDVPRSLYLVTFKPGTYKPIWIGQWKGAGYKIALGLEGVGWI